jgi:archaellum component FlaC
LLGSFKFKYGINFYMATDKTPNHKRIKRAEEGRDEWKMKALSRREENEKLRSELSEKAERLDCFFDENSKLKNELSEADKRIAKLEKEVEGLKKKASK